MNNCHTFHIPVMGLGYTVDSPVKVAALGISSVVALADDLLLEKMRAFYCNSFGLPYVEISSRELDYRSSRVREYLNVLDEIVKRKWDELKHSVLEKGTEIEKFIDLLPEKSEIREAFHQLKSETPDVKKAWAWVKDHLTPGSIDVNIMTKLDKENYYKKEKLPQEYNDAHAALRGFATSNLRSSVVLSAGMNPYLYSYMEQFSQFFPDEKGVLQKKITLKVSDYRSALIQGKFLAKKGLWVSEFRVESGLNCGGHAFATDGFLMGPVLEEFKIQRNELTDTLFAVYRQGLSDKGLSVPDEAPAIRLTAQGGVGTADEHRLLIDYYGMDSVGWGTPFMLVPEATTVDDDTLELLANAREEDLYLSNVSPLGVPFNNVRNNTKDKEKMERAAAGRPGSPCTKQHLRLFRDDDGSPICTASIEYQRKKLGEIEAAGDPDGTQAAARQNILDKVCLCVGLATSAQMANGIDTGFEGTAVSVCPGPNLAWFDRIMSLKEMAGHIYGKNNVISRTDRPHMFVSELRMYVDYLKDKANEAMAARDAKIARQLKGFKGNLIQGIEYYRHHFSREWARYNTKPDLSLKQLDDCAAEVLSISVE